MAAKTTTCPSSLPVYFRNSGNTDLIKAVRNTNHSTNGMRTVLFMLMRPFWSSAAKMEPRVPTKGLPQRGGVPLHSDGSNFSFLSVKTRYTFSENSDIMKSAGKYIPIHSNLENGLR